jgi:hypothetical protein
MLSLRQRYHWSRSDAVPASFTLPLLGVSELSRASNGCSSQATGLGNHTTGTTTSLSLCLQFVAFSASASASEIPAGNLDDPLTVDNIVVSDRGFTPTDSCATVLHSATFLYCLTLDGRYGMIIVIGEFST